MQKCVPRHDLTPVLFHGPSSELDARKFAKRIGEVVWEGLLTTEVARGLVERSMEGSLCGRLVWIAGPVDEASPMAVDVLLKVLEEGSGMDAVFWGYDELDVPATLRSRCHSWWCRGFGDMDPWVGIPGNDELKEDPRKYLEKRASSLWRSKEFDWKAWINVRSGLCTKNPSLWDLGVVVKDAWR